MTHRREVPAGIDKLRSLSPRLPQVCVPAAQRDCLCLVLSAPGLNLPATLQICLHIDGSIPVKELLDILNTKVDPLILAHQAENAPIPPPGWKRPFLETGSKGGPIIKADAVEVVPFMEKDESVGEVVIGWRGPKDGDFREELVS